LPARFFVDTQISFEAGYLFYNVMMKTDISSPSHFVSHIRVTADDMNNLDSTAPASNVQAPTALDILASKNPLSKQKLKSVMSNGAVWLENDRGIDRLRRAKKSVHEGEILHLYYDEAIQETHPQPADLIADEGDYSIWNKPYGMYSQGTKWGDHCTIYRWAESQLQRPSFLVHRLDRAANGLIIIAHGKKTAAAFARLFEKRKIKKLYRIEVTGNYEELRKMIQTLPYTISSPIDEKPAVSRIIAIEESEKKDRIIVHIEIETGRKHQVRKHMAALGYPVIGDRLYGSKQLEENLQLQSRYLKFTCPISGSIREYSL
jgi:tRNA pseudouridine32 synthase/23S rRNA pseudouridine746 synthase